MVCGDDPVQARFSGDLDKFLVGGGAIGIICVNVKSESGFKHWVDGFLHLWV